MTPSVSALAVLIMAITAVGAVLAEIAQRRRDRLRARARREAFAQDAAEAAG